MLDNYTCPNCGTQINYGQNMCENCGCQLKWQDISQEPNLQDVSAINNNECVHVKDFNMADAVRSFFKTIATLFSGRARRKEYWYMVLFNILLFVPGVIISALMAVSAAFMALYFVYIYIYTIYMFVAVLPATALSVRRLHDIGKSGWWLLISIIPLVGGIILLVWMCKDGDKFENKYGVSTKYVNS